jgi:hypothetical protein
MLRRRLALYSLARISAPLPKAPSLPESTILRVTCKSFMRAQ